MRHRIPRAGQAPRGTWTERAAMKVRRERHASADAKHGKGERRNIGCKARSSTIRSRSLKCSLMGLQSPYGAAVPPRRGATALKMRMAGKEHAKPCGLEGRTSASPQSPEGMSLLVCMATVVSVWVL